MKLKTVIGGSAVYLDYVVQPMVGDSVIIDNVEFVVYKREFFGQVDLDFHLTIYLKKA